MEKSIFFFARKPERSPEDFEHHYINRHAPLGKRLTRCLRGYSVNLLGGDGYPAAITEHWVPTVLDILTPERAYASMDDFNEVFVDDQSLFAGFELYVVTDERIVGGGDIPEAPLESQTPGRKLIESFADADRLPPPHERAVRVVDNVVSHKLEMTENYTWERTDAEMAIIRMSWFADATDLAGDSDGWRVREYRFIAPQALAGA